MSKEKPYGIISDTHNHDWSAFSKTNADGINSRLQIILEETRRAANAVKAAGGDTLYHAGDLFHVRGKLAPSVLNPTLDCYRNIAGVGGVKIIILAGNHDLEGEHSTRLGSAVTALEGVGCSVINSHAHGFVVSPKVVMVPWIKGSEELKRVIELIDPKDREGVDLIIHAPIDGVIKGLPNHGLTADYLSKLGFRRVFSGHYHNHKDFGNGVYSIGALTHHTWSDVGSKAGFLIVSQDEVKWHSTLAPQFIEIDDKTDLDDLPLIADGNYIKAKVSTEKVADIEEMRRFLTQDCNAAGCVIVQHKAAAAVKRDGATAITASTSLEDSVNSYIASKSLTNAAELQKLCLEILTQAKAVA